MHMHVGHRFEWTKKAQAVWMDTGPYVPRLFDDEDRQIAESYGDVIKEEAWAGHPYPRILPGVGGPYAVRKGARDQPASPGARAHSQRESQFPCRSHGVLRRTACARGKGLEDPSHTRVLLRQRPPALSLYERCQREGLVVMFHAGTSLFPGVSRCVMPTPIPSTT